MVDYLQLNFKSDHVAIAWIYCDYKHSSEQTLVNLIGSLLKQLVQERRISDDVKRLYEHHSKRSTRPTPEEVGRLAKSEISSYSKAFILVDALDECPEESGTRQNLLKELQSLPGNVNLMITSRDLPTIQQEFKGERRLDVSANREDVTRYIQGRISREDRLLRHIKADPTLKDAIMETIVGRVEGM